MTTFVERVQAYPLVSDSCEAISGIYKSSKQNDKIGYVCGIAENLAGNVASRVKTIAENNQIISKVDNLACNYVLNPLEKKVVQVNYPSEQILGPWANYAVKKMENLADCFLPVDDQDKSENMDRQMRLVRLKGRLQAKLIADSSRIVTEIQKISSMIAENVSIAVIKQQIEYIMQLMNSKFRAIVRYFSGPAIEQNFVYLRHLLSKLLEDMSLGKIKESLSFKSLQEILEKMQSQLTSLKSDNKKVSLENAKNRPIDQEESYEVAEVRVVPITPMGNQEAGNQSGIGINEEQLALNESISLGQINLGSFFRDPDERSVSDSSSSPESFEDQ